MVVRVMLSMPPEFLSRVDEVAAREHRSRSDLVREALRRYLESRYGLRGIGEELGALEPGSRGDSTDSND